MAEDKEPAASAGDPKKTPRESGGAVPPFSQGVLDPFDVAFRDFCESLYRIAGVVATSYGEAYREYLTALEQAHGDPSKQREAYHHFIHEIRHVWENAKQETLSGFHGYTNCVHTLWDEVDVELLSPEVAAAIAANLYNAGYWTRAAEYNLWLALTYSAGGWSYGVPAFVGGNC
jgi:hypothetical protein